MRLAARRLAATEKQVAHAHSALKRKADEWHARESQLIEQLTEKERSNAQLLERLAQQPTLQVARQDSLNEAQRWSLQCLSENYQLAATRAQQNMLSALSDRQYQSKIRNLQSATPKSAPSPVNRFARSRWTILRDFRSCPRGHPVSKRPDRKH